MSDLAVVKIAEAEDHAYSMGYNKFNHLSGEETEDFDLAPYKDGAGWCNNALPSLRALAGYDDAGHGTWQVDRTVAVIEPGDEDDNPAEAVETHSSRVLSDLVEAFDRGAYDAVDGKKRAHAEVV